MSTRVFCVVFSLVFVVALSAGGQPVVDQVAGTVADPFGSPLPAEVTLESISGYRDVAVTGSDGRFLFPSVVIGSYTLTVVSEGFATAVEDIVAEAASLELAVVLQPEEPATLVVTATDPQGLVLPGVVVTLSGPSGASLEGLTGPDGVFETGPVRPGRWAIEGFLSGFAVGFVETRTFYGSAVRAVVSLGLGYEVAEDLIVLGATRPVGRRSRVRVMDSPVTTSVIPGDSLVTQASPTVGDSLRGVPGLNVVQLSARDIQITSRQSTGILANSQLVLMDGRSIYLDFFGMVLWDSLPVGSDDIEQIEVVRGPASVTWGPNAMTGAVHFITKSPRESVGTTVTMGAGWTDRNVGSTAGSGPGLSTVSNVSMSRAPSDTLAYRISAGYFRSAALPRPVGRVPVVADPRVPTGMVGGAYYPADGPGPFGGTYVNRGTAQPKLDFRIDQDLDGGGQLTYAGGVGATEGVTHTGLGPFDLRRGSYVGYGKLGYNRGDLRLQVFTNIVEGVAPSLLLADPAAGGGPVSFGFSNRTVDLDVGHSRLVGDRHVLGYGANVRYNTFSLNIAPEAPSRLEFGAYLEDEVFLGPVRLVVGGRLDKFGSVRTPFFSPRVSAVFKPADDHSIVASYNRAFRSPSVVESFLDLRMLQPVDLSGLASFRPFLGGLLPPGLDPVTAGHALTDLEDRLDQTTSMPFPLAVQVLGSDVAVPGRAAEPLGAESLTAYELRYAGSMGSSTGLGAAVYVNRGDRSLIGVPVAPDFDPYTAESPPVGWVLPPQALTLMSGAGIHLPRTVSRFVNRGGTRNTGLELWLDQGLGPSTAVRVAYSWQARPVVLDDERPYPVAQLSLPPAHRLAVLGMFDGSRFLGSAGVVGATRAFWADVLSSEYHGFSSAYLSVDAAFGVKWRSGGLVTSVKVTNLLNRTIQQHVFGDFLRRAVFAELRLRL